MDVLGYSVINCQLCTRFICSSLRPYARANIDRKLSASVIYDSIVRYEIKIRVFCRDEIYTPSCPRPSLVSRPIMICKTQTPFDLLLMCGIACCTTNLQQVVQQIERLQQIGNM